MSGLNQYIANVPYAKVYRGFESLSLRHTTIPSCFILSHKLSSYTLVKELTAAFVFPRVSQTILLLPVFFGGKIGGK